MRVVRKLAHFQFRIWNLFGVRERERRPDGTSDRMRMRMRD